MKRMRSGFQAVLFVGFLVFGHVAYSQTLWQNAQHGMTIEQVKGVYPNAVSVMGSTAPDDGSRELLQLPGVMIASESFSAGFFFKNNKLTCVKLRPDDEYTQAQCERLYTVLQQSLAAKYGRAQGTGSSAGINYRLSYTTWVSDGIDIYLSEEFVGRRTVLELFYRKGVVDAVDFDNL
jgi:hypothetical protein